MRTHGGPLLSPTRQLVITAIVACAVILGLVVVAVQSDQSPSSPSVLEFEAKDFVEPWRRPLRSLKQIHAKKTRELQQQHPQKLMKAPHSASSLASLDDDPSLASPPLMNQAGDTQQLAREDGREQRGGRREGEEGEREEEDERHGERREEEGRRGERREGEGRRGEREFDEGERREGEGRRGLRGHHRRHHRGLPAPPKIRAEDLVDPVGVSDGFDKWMDRLPFGNKYQQRIKMRKEQEERMREARLHDPSALLVKAGKLNRLLKHRVGYLRRMLKKRLSEPASIVVNVKRPGLPGSRGPNGPSGPAGVQGPTGLPGPEGLRGSPGPGGPPGPAGKAGLPGPQGQPGSPGPKGISGRQGEPGYPGRRGHRGPRGERAPPAPRGHRGPRGPRGETGAPGLPGFRGIRGEAGPKGPSRRVQT